MTFHKRSLLYCLLAVLLLGMGLSWQWWQSRRMLQHADLAGRAGQVFSEMLVQLDSSALHLLPRMGGIRFNERNFNAQLNRQIYPNSTTWCVFEGDSLVYWSDNRVQPEPAWRFTSSNPVKLLGNGWYYIKAWSEGNRTLMCLILIQHQYIFQNRFLENRFHASLELPEDAHLEAAASRTGYAIKDVRGQVLFRISFSKEENNIACPTVSSWLYGLAIAAAFLLSVEALYYYARKRSLKAVPIALLCVLARFAMADYRWPAGLYDSELFSSTYYASGFLLNSLGDLLLSVSIIALLIIGIYAWLLQSGTSRSGSFNRVMVVMMFYFTFLLSVLNNYLLGGLIINSQISFDTSNVFELSIFTGAGMVVIGMLLTTLYLLCEGSIQLIRKAGFGLTAVTMLFLTSQGLFLLTLLACRDTELFSDYGVSAFLLANVLMLFIGYIRMNEKQLFSFSRSLLLLLVFSLYAAQMIFSFNRIRETDKRQLLAAKLENEQDIVAEFLLQNIENKLRHDQRLNQYMDMPLQALMSSPSLMEGLGRQLNRQYFSGYLARYDTRFKYFSSSEVPINAMGDPGWNLDAIRKRIMTGGRPGASSSFYFLQGTSGRSEYIGILRLGEAGGTLVVEMQARSSGEERGFPELLLSDKVGAMRDFSNYSYARYRQGKLSTQSGSYNYYLTDAPYSQYFRNLNGMRFVYFDRHMHLFYRYEGNLIILSAPEKGIIGWFTTFSYVFTFFSVCAILISFTVRLIREGWKLRLNFKSRIQITIVTIVIATLLLAGAATVAYIVRNYEAAQNKRIREKLNNLRVLTENEMGGREVLPAELTDDLQYSLERLATTLNTDFSLYNTAGRLFFSSQQGIYEQGISASLMSREALSNLTVNQRAMFIQRENIGNLFYSSAYEPVRNSNNKTIGYVNLPYFGRDSELKRDISGFLAALINIYVLLFSVSILIAFFVSNRITYPLRIIQESLKRTQLGRSNEPIVWKTRDEIGALIAEYNSMLVQLQESASLLARSERESAWREMAKQVAHEIKNPLTPMKLSIQHLQRAIDTNHPDKDVLVRKLSVTLIEQIDTLSNIATEFSHFAKMPRPEYTDVELLEVVRHSCELYSEDSNSEIRFESKAERILVRADKDQLVRIFSNLIKNALQAIPDDREGRISVRVTEEERSVLVEVEDNGIGIPADKQSRIFTPNFTTKSSGTGLGLAMVKTMAEGMDGKVWFETQQGKGTSFFIRLNKIGGSL